MRCIDIGSDTALFFDDRYIAESEGICIIPKEAERCGKILEGDRPWEPYGTILPVVIRYDNRYYLYYTAPQKNYQLGIKERHTCLAVSGNGLDWEKPELGLFDICGTRGNNVALPGCVGTVFIDPNNTQGAPFWWIGNGEENPLWKETEGMVYQPGKEGGVYLFNSRDGIIWNRAAKKPVLPFWCDTLNQCFWDDHLNKYVAYVRGWHDTYGRVVCRCETESLLKTPWPYKIDPDRSRGPRGLFGPVGSELPVVMHTDNDDPPDSDLYTPLVHKYPWAPETYLAFPPLYRHYPDKTENIPNPNSWNTRGGVSNDGPIASELAVSRDGVHWKRFRRAYIRQGIIGEQDGGGDIRMGLGMIREGKYITQYYMGKGYPHKLRKEPPFTAVFRARQRLDGFAAARFSNDGGWIITPYLKFRGDRLAVNTDCGARGEVWMEIQNTQGTGIPGFTLSECISADRNDTEQEIRWRSGAEVSSLQDKPVRLRIFARSADLYGFRFG